MSPSLSLRAYERLLILYPADLRRDFGADMLEAFADDLAAARGMRGALGLWRSALREILQIAVPAWLEVPEVLVPLLSAATVVVSQSPLLVLAARGQLVANLTAIGIGGTLSAITSFVAIYRWKRAGLTTLRLG